jgi:tryptophan synthase alpha chain
MSVSAIGSNAIDQAFANAKEMGKTLLIPFVTVGDPDPETTIDILLHMQEAGAAMIELGVPYSDPLADGPVIQRASQRALKHKITINDCMKLADKARIEGVRIPLILFTYFNPVLQYGMDRFFSDLKKHDFSAVIIPDLPIEESEEWKTEAESNSLYLIPFVAPTSNERIERIAKQATGGFIYCVSSLGVTGERTNFHESIETFIRTIKQHTNVPLAVGFGVSGREQFQQLSKHVEGVIVGSAIVRKIEEVIDDLHTQEKRADGLLEIRQFVRHFLS